MGLAASQARFLAITARKGDCETRSMEIAQEKLSITHQLAQASEEYEEALDATRLVWDGDTGTVYDLSYDIMMSPSELNGYSPYLITNRTGQIVLSDQLATAARAAGLNEICTQGSLDGRNAFVLALADVGYISGSTAAAITGDKVEITDASDNVTGYYWDNSVEWSASAGFGGDPLDKSQASAMTLSTMVNYMNNVLDTNYWSKYVGTVQGDNYQALYDAMQFTLNASFTSSSSKNLIHKDNSGSDTVTSFTLADLFTKDYYLMMDISNTDLTDELTQYLKGADASTLSVATQQLLDIIDRIYDAFGLMFGSDEASKTALDYAKKQTIQQIIDNSTSGKYRSGLRKGSADINGALYSTKQGKSCISLSNIAEMFLTNYAVALDGYNSGYYVGSKSDKSNYVTDDYNYMYVLANQESVYDEKDLMIADFINVLYNNICAYGWTTCEGNDITDNSFLQSCLKNGTYFISSLNTDNYYYQDHYTKNGCVGEITDDDAITQAEAKYNTMKTKLNYKEETLELELKNLDLEISSLTTEYDTVKSMISKNVEKIFTLFSS